LNAINSNQNKKPESGAHATGPARTRSSDLLGATGMLKIEHQGAVYVLRATSKGGLILTK